jgi:hypothetical protein
MKTSTKYRIIEVGSVALALLLMAFIVFFATDTHDLYEIIKGKTAILNTGALAIGIITIVAVIGFLAFKVSLWAGKKRRYHTAKEAYPDLAAFGLQPFPTMHTETWPKWTKVRIHNARKDYDGDVSFNEELLQDALELLKRGNDDEFKRLISAVRESIEHINRRAQELIILPLTVREEEQEAHRLLQEHADIILKGKFIIAVAKQQGFVVDEEAQTLRNSQKINDEWKEKLYKGDDLDLAHNLLQVYDTALNVELAKDAVDDVIQAMEASHIITSNIPTLLNHLQDLQKRYKAFPVREISSFIDLKLQTASPAAERLRENIATIKELKDFKLLMQARSLITMQRVDLDDYKEAIELFNNTSEAAIGLEHLLDDTLILYRACKEAEARDTTEKETDQTT